jgi:dephospho-CoA kinase
MSETTKQITTIGLTGGIGSGKSSAAKEFHRLGAQIIDSDALAHQVTSAGGVAMPAIEAAFGKDFLMEDGSLNRPKMREYVFNHRPALTILESITHPLIQEASHAAFQVALKQDPLYIIFMIPLLFESNKWQGRFNKIIVIDCTVETQIQRVLLRNNIQRNQVEKIIAAQIPREDRLKNADFIINNDGLLIELNMQVIDIHQKIIGL